MSKQVEKTKQYFDSEYANQSEKLMHLKKHLTKKDQAHFNKLYRNGNYGTIIMLYDSNKFNKQLEKCL
jgi:hypothetical protein